MISIGANRARMVLAIGLAIIILWAGFKTLKAVGPLSKQVQSRPSINLVGQ